MGNYTIVSKQYRHFPQKECTDWVAWINVEGYLLRLDFEISDQVTIADEDVEKLMRQQIENDLADDNWWEEGHMNMPFTEENYQAAVAKWQEAGYSE